MAKQFIVEEKSMKKIKDNIYEINSSEVKHIQVLRHNVGDNIIVNNKIYKILKITKTSIEVEYLYDAEKNHTTNIKVILYLAFLKNEMMELAIKKAVELGVNEIVPFFSNNVVVKLDSEKDLEKKLEKQKKIVIEAVKQCGRTDIPVVHKAVKFENIFSEVESNDFNIFAYENEKESIKDIIYKQKEDNKRIKNIGIIVGPEGGFTVKESEELKNIKNLKSVSLGRRILRSETAVCNLLSIVMYEYEEND